MPSPEPGTWWALRLVGRSHKLVPNYYPTPQGKTCLLFLVVVFFNTFRSMEGVFTMFLTLGEVTQELGNGVHHGNGTPQNGTVEWIVGAF